MSYIGHSVENRISPVLKEDFVGDGSATVFYFEVMKCQVVAFS